MAALFTHKKMCYHQLKRLVHGGSSRVGGSSGSTFIKLGEGGIACICTQSELGTRDLQLVMQGPCCFQIGHVVQIKLETGVNFRFVSLLP